MDFWCAVKATIKVKVHGCPDLPTFELEADQPAETVVDTVARELEVETGVLLAGQCQFIGYMRVPAGEYVFKAMAAQPKGIR